MAEERLLDALAPLVDAVGAEFVDVGQARPSDVVVDWAGAPAFALRLPGLHRSLDRLVAQVEAELGAPIDGLSRDQQRHAVRLLDELGAFMLRRSVDDVAKAIGISRFTVYNYINAAYR